ncbi:MAG TPA: glycerophosphodiester phosphodiesterase family protein [Bacillota bacterium]|nr:glycerophosphodiester phosphodiesterase family protein [Bacillota bacterium]
MLKSKIFWVIPAIFIFGFLNNSSLLMNQTSGKPWFMAHRGLAQTFSMEGITGDTCTAERIYPPEHPYLENTLPSMEAAFAYGAKLVELDIQPTRDEQLAVFHDWTLDCRTDGRGVTREHTMAELKLLDIGYGYTADGGKTYPFRGQGIGSMPTLTEVFARFPNSPLLIHIKSDDPEEGNRLAKFLASFPEERLNQLAVYGGDKPIAALQKRLPRLRVMSKATMMKALVSYLLVGWTGYVPPACRNTELHLPEKYARWLWGWPQRFMDRMEKANTRVILVAGNGVWSEGFDSLEDMKRLPPHYTGGVWTNRIDKVAQIEEGK